MLSKGPKFAITPSLKAIDFAAPVEAGLKLAEVPDQKKEVIRIRVCDAIKRSRQPEANFSTDERRALKKLQTDKKIKILHADKGNATVVMDTKDYDKKAKTLLQDEDSYSRFDSDPTRQPKGNYCLFSDP